MAKINLCVNLDDNEILTDAALQAIKNQVRSLVDKEMNISVRRVIEECADARARQIVSAVTSSYYSPIKETIKSALINKAAELEISESFLKEQVDEMLQPVKRYVFEKKEEIKKKTADIDVQIAKEIRQRVDAVFNDKLIDALTEALAKRK